MVHIALCDDERLFAKSFIDMLAKNFKNVNLDCDIVFFENGESLLAHEEGFDVYFLDFEMPEPDGFEVAGKIRKKWGNAPELIFVTSHQEMVYDAFRYDVTAFIRKCNLEEDLDKNMPFIIRKAEWQNAIYEIKSEKMTVYKHIEQIIYVEVYAHRLTFHCDDGEYFARGRMESAEKQLTGYGFVKTHRCYLINMRFLKRIESGRVILDYGKIINIPLSKYRTQDVKREFLKYMA